MSTTSEKDRIWRPFTQMKEAPIFKRAIRGEGPYLYLEDGSKVLDMVSSWWVNIHGHANKDIAEAIFKQASRLEHVIFAEFSHEPAELLCKNLSRVLPQGIDHIFFSDNGSTAVEVGMKMAYQYWWNKGRKRDSFIAFEGGYHGDTIGAMSLGSGSGFFKPFKSLLFQVDSVPYPVLNDDKTQTTVEEKELISLNKIRELVTADDRSYAGIIIEPLVQGAAGMRMCRPEFLKSLNELARELDLIIIYDEVMTGFGRTGDWFAATRSKTIPDIICLSKGITGGFLPLAVTCANEKVYQSFYSDDKTKTFYHGHSYTANPIACAAALKSLELLNENHKLFEQMEGLHQKHGEFLKSHHKTKNFRVCGTISAFEINTTTSDSYFNEVGKEAKCLFLQEGILIRPLGNTVYLMPPYITDESILEHVYITIEKVLDRIELN